MQKDSLRLLAGHIVKRVGCQGKTTFETYNPFTNPSRAMASIDDLLSWRGVRLGVQNHRFDVRDVALREEQKQILTGQLQRIVATFRIAVIDLIRSEARTIITVAL